MSSELLLPVNAGHSKLPRNTLLSALVVLAIMSWSMSFLFYTAPQREVGSGQIGPISASSRRAVDVHAPPGLGSAPLRSIDLRFQFRVAKFVTYENLFQTGPNNLGIRAEMSPNIQGHRSIDLISQFTDGTSFVTPLVENTAIGKTYAIVIKIYRGSRITAWVDGQKQFTYSYATPIIEPSLGSVAVGTGYNQTRPFDGVVNGFKLSYREFVSSTSSTTPMALQVTAALLSAIAAVLFLFTFATGGLTARLSARSTKRVPDHWWDEGLGRRYVLLGLLLVVVGTTILEVVTPPENAVLQQSGEQNFALAGVSPGKMTNYSLGSTPQLFKSAASLDVSISFDMKLDATPPRGSQFSPVVVSTLNGNEGIDFYLLPGGGLAATWGQVYLPTPTGALLSKRLPRNQWISVQAIMKRNQSSQILIDGQQVSAFMWAVPNLNVLPSQVVIGGDPSATVGGSAADPQLSGGSKSGTFGGSVTNLKMKVVLYREPSSRVNYLLVRSSQLLAILAIAFGTILLASRFLSRLIPLAAGVHRSLVLIVFGTAGIGIVVNLFIDQLHVQQSPVPYFERSTWLATPIPRFSDFMQVFEIFKSLNPYGVQAGNYPPVGFWLVSPFSWMSQYASLYVFLSVCAGFMLWWFARSFTQGLSRIGQALVVATLCLSLPVSFAFDRANIDLLVFIFVVLGTAAFEQRRSGLAAVWIGMAGAAKIFPGLYLLLFLRGRKPYLILAIAVVICATLLATLGFDGSLRQNLDRLPSDLFSSNPGGTVGSTYYNNSLVGAAQGFGLAINGMHGMEVVWRAIQPFTIYLETTGITFLTWYLWFKEKSLWRSTTLATVAFLLLPTVSYYYELIFLLIPVALFIRQGSVNARTLRIACLFGLILAPKAYFYIANSQVDISVLFTAPLLVALGAAVIHDGVCERRISTNDNPSVSHAELGDDNIPSHAAKQSESIES